MARHAAVDFERMDRMNANAVIGVNQIAETEHNGLGKVVERLLLPAAQASSDLFR